MTNETNHLDGVMTDDDEGDQMSPSERDAWERSEVFASGEDAQPDQFPRLWNLSIGMMKRAIIRPVVPTSPEFLTIRMRERVRSDDESIKQQLAVHEWNALWEAGQFRRRFFDEQEDLTPDLVRIAERGDVNVFLVPRTPSRYHEFAPLYHLLSRDTCERFGLPLVSSGQWPYGMDYRRVDKYMPSDFEHRLSRAWASTVWRHLNSGSAIGAFSSRDPIRLLAHNLDYWIPPVTSVIQETLGTYPVVVGDGDLPDRVSLVDGSTLDGAIPGWPRKGGDLWRGEEEAAEFVDWTVEAADSTGSLRGIIDAVRSHRLDDDFSPQWSNARIDFERKLHRTRNKVSVKFVELKDKTLVVGPESEIEGRLVTADFLALLSPKEREIVVLLTSGWTTLGQVAEQMGYANHSAVSKKLARIRDEAIRYFEHLD